MSLTRRKKFLSWLKTNENSKHLVWEAANTEVMYDPDHLDPTQRLKIFDIPVGKYKKDFFKKLWENVWVPGYKLRGKSYSDRNFDAQLSQTSTIMSLSSFFDMVCTAPILFYLTKAAGIFALPLSFGYGYFLLIMSNKAGEYSMNRPKDNNQTANILLLIFFLLSLVKTLSAGVGIDLVSRSGEIKNLTAEKFIHVKSSRIQNNVIFYEDLLKSSKKDCNRLIEEQSKLNKKRRKQLDIYNSLDKKMNRSPLNIKSSDPKFLLDNYSSQLGSCTKVNLINKLNDQNKFKFKNSQSIRSNLYDRLPAISALYVFQRNKYNDVFSGNPILGTETDLKKYVKSFKDSNIEFNIDCFKKECNKSVEWSNPGKAINEASKQFYGRIINKEWDSLGLSYIGFLISILLSSTATILLYASSIDIRNRASRSEDVENWKDQYFQEMNEDN